MFAPFATLGLVLLSTTTASIVPALHTRQSNASAPDSCPGYAVRNPKTGKGTLKADLVLAGTACNVYGPDIQNLKLEVYYEDETRIHLKITAADDKRYEVPEEAFTRPVTENYIDSGKANIKFNYTSSPFSFTIYRSSTKEVLFDSSASSLVFEPQYLRLKTKLPSQANIYGLGEHSGPFRFDPKNTTRTLWNRDAGIPAYTNLYGAHPVYFEHRTTGTHGVFLLNSNGMDIKLTEGALEYNVIGGVLDFYFLAGPTAISVAQQYGRLVGLPAEVPYWSFGLHQCRYGYKDYVELSKVITNYAKAGIPLETMWTDIDYMYKRWIFTNDPDYFPTPKMREIVDYLHNHHQQYILMIDPAVASQPDVNYTAYDHGVEQDVFLKYSNGSLFHGVVWPGVAVFPDWFNKLTTSYWTSQIKRFFNKETGIDVDGIWIDMNEASNFCEYPCDPYATAIAAGNPPPRLTPPPAPNTPIFTKRQVTSSKRDIVNPPYSISNGFPNLSWKTIPVEVVHQNGLEEYDTHNLYGTMMSSTTREAMLARRPGLKPLIITRSTFSGAGAKVGHWLGDNTSNWVDYRASIAGMLGMASIFQIPMSGSDVCGFAENTTETLCARWATLGAFNPFYRNHNVEGAISQEFYVWPSVAEAAKNAISIRYRLLDYMYTHFHRAHVDGTPILNPLWFFYPQDVKTFAIDLQFFYGDWLMVSPVTQENSTSVDYYVPNDIFYDFTSFAPRMGTGATVTANNVGYSDIPLHIRGGGILPLRSESAMTTHELRQKDFHIVVAPNRNGTAQGSLYVDDGVSIEQPKTLDVAFTFAKNELKAQGRFDYDVGVKVTKISFLGVKAKPAGVSVSGGGKMKGYNYDSSRQVVDVEVELSLKGGFSVKMK